MSSKNGWIRTLEHEHFQFLFDKFSDYIGKLIETVWRGIQEDFLVQFPDWKEWDMPFWRIKRIHRTWELGQQRSIEASAPCSNLSARKKYVQPARKERKLIVPIQSRR